MSFTVRVAINPSDKELDEATASLSAAFKHSFFIECLDDKREYSDLFIRAHLTAAAVGGELVFAEVPDKGVIGVAVWFGPGQSFLGTEEQREKGWNQLKSKLTPESCAWWKYCLSRYSELDDQTFGIGTKHKGYHLQLLGVAPEYHRKGVARAMMRVGEAKAAALKVGTYLETVEPGNVKIYQAMGYEIAGAGAIETPAHLNSAALEMTFFVLHTERTSSVSSS